MVDALTGFLVVGAAILVGWIIARIDLLGAHAQPVLSRLTYFVLSPILLFVVLAEADVRMLFSALLPVSAIAAISVMGVFVLVSTLVWRRSLGEVVIGTIATGQVNSNNIGIPLSLYLLGSAAYPAPVLLMQLLAFTPVTMALLDAVSSGRRSFGHTVVRTVLNPIVAGSALGVLVAVSGIELSPLVMEPLHLLAGACVPVLLISYGISLHGQRVLGSRGRRRDVVLASFLKVLVMPLIAWVTARFLFDLPAHDVFVVVMLAALPTAQNVFNYAQRFSLGETVARETVLLTTIGCVPVLLLITFLLG